MKLSASGSRKDAMEPIERSKTFSLDGEHLNKHTSPTEVPLPWLPPKEMVFNLMFFRHLFNDMAKQSKLSLVSLRNLSYTITEVMQLGNAQTVNFFGKLTKHKIQWKEKALRIPKH